MEAATGAAMAQAVVTPILDKVLSLIKEVLVCGKTCRKLEKDLERIRPDVWRIEQQLHFRRQMNALEPLGVVEDWLARLKHELDIAEEVVHECCSGSRLNFVKNRPLTRRIKSLLANINQMAGNDVDRATLSSTLFNSTNHGPSTPTAGWQSSPEGSQYDYSHHRPGMSPGVSGMHETQRQNGTHGQPHPFDQRQQPQYGNHAQHHAPPTYYPPGWPHSTPNGNYTHYG